MCNQELYGDLSNPKPVPSTINQYPQGVRNSEYFNTASICHLYKNNGVYDRCLMARNLFQNALEGTAAKVSIPRAAQECDDYDLWYETSPSSDPVTLLAQRKQYCTAADGGINLVQAYNSEHCPGKPDGCIGDTPIDVTTGKIIGLVSNSVVNVEKKCAADALEPIAHLPYLYVSWQLDARWAGMQFTPDSALNRYIHVSLRPGRMTDRSVFDLILAALLNQFIQAPVDQSSTTDKKLPYFFTQSPNALGWGSFLIQSLQAQFTSSLVAILNKFGSSITIQEDIFGNPVANDENLIPKEVLAYPNGNYQIEIQPVAVIDFGGPMPIAGHAEVATYCNPESLNFCWDKRNLYKVYDAKGNNRCPVLIP